MALAANGLVTVEEVREAIEVPDAVQTSRLESLIGYASGEIESRLGRILRSQAYAQELYDGYGGNSLNLNQYPVTEVSAIDFLDIAYPASWTAMLSGLATAVIEPRWRRKIILRGASFPPCGKGVVRVSYTAGFTTIPDELKEFCLMLVSREFRISDKRLVGVKSVALQGQTTTFEDDEEIWKKIDKYRSYV